jgi:plastocyanin
MKASSLRIILLMLISATLMSACSQATKQASQAADKASQAKPQTVAVEIRNFSFNPAEVTINNGDTVTWRNTSESVHTVTSVTGKLLDSGDIGPGETFSHTFTEAGTFSYYCYHHVVMKGKVVVK